MLFIVIRENRLVKPQKIIKEKEMKEFRSFDFDYHPKSLGFAVFLSFEDNFAGVAIGPWSACFNWRKNET